MPALALIIEIDADDPQCATVFADGCIATHPYRFVLDTGASRTQVVPDAYIDSLATTGEHRTHGVFSESSLRIVRLPDLVVGPLHSTSIEASVAPVTVGDTPRLIGMDLLRDHRLHFLFDQALLLVDESPGKGDLHELAVDGAGHLYIDAAWPSASARCVWDSGAGMTIVDHAFWLRHPDLFTAVGPSTGTDAAGVKRTATTFDVSALEIGGHTFAAHHVTVVDLSAANSTLAVPMDMILGYPTLRQAHWYFDVPARRWCITS